jgi:hypothetical protein
VQRLARGPVTAVAPAALPPADLHLGACYPNPVAGGDAPAMLPFTLARRAAVTVAVFNSAGREVARVLERTLEPGSYAAPWRPGALPAGTYFFTVTAGSDARTGRVTVLR